MSSSSEEETPDTPDTTVDRLIKDATVYSSALRGADLPEATNFPPQLRGKAFYTSKDAKVRWNCEVDEVLKTEILAGCEGRIELTLGFLKIALKCVKNLKRRLRVGIKNNVLHIVTLRPGNAFMLFDVYLSLVGERVLQANRDPRHDKRLSLDVLSDKSEASAARIVYPLTTKHIHHNMFLDGSGLRLQDFRRFQFPAGVDTVPNDYEDIVEKLDTIQQFLVSAEPRLDQKGTQAVFSLFLEHFLLVFNDLTQDDGGEACRVAQVTDMNSVGVQATMSERYMKKNTELRELAKKAITRHYGGKGNWESELSIKSDLVICPASTATQATGKIGEDQRRRFEDCHVNIEMKRFRFLIDTKNNKQPLTQVSVESLAQKSCLLNAPKVLFSLLTDHCAFYAVCHITSDTEPDIYWISKRVVVPRDAVAVILWLLNCSRAASIDVPALRNLLISNAVPADDNEPENDDRKPGAKDDFEAKDRDDHSVGSNESRQHKRSRSEKADCAVAPVSMDLLFGSDSISNDDSENSPDFDFFYAQQMIRQSSSQAFQFSGGPLATCRDL